MAVAIQDALDDLCTRRKIPGAVLGVARGDDVTVAVHGTANLHTGLPVVRETLFQAGSIGKSYTATAVMQLVDGGAVSLDAPLKEYLPDLEFEDPGVTETLTARQVLTHTAGIDGDRLDDEFEYGRGDDCLARYVAGLHDLPLITRPGGLWSYCNSGYVVLGRLVEVLTGAPYEKALTDRLLEPLGVTNTLFFPGDMVTHSLAVGHVKPGDDDPVVAPKWEMSRAAGPAGSTINTTIDDLLAFARMHLRDGLAGDGTARVISAASARAMREPLVECPEPELLGDHWGLGWFVRTVSGPHVVGHDGNTHGMTACLRLVPEKDAAWGLLMNLAGQNWAAMEVARSDIDELLGTVTPGRPEPATGVTVDADGLTGTYESIASRLTVTSDGDGLHLTVGPKESEGAMTGDLLPLSDGRFVLRIPELGDDLPLTFLDGYIHMGARLYRQTGMSPLV